MTKAFETIDGQTLMSTPLRPMNFIISTFLSQGLHILAGLPKVGKSWLALWLSVMVAKGDPIWGMEVKKGTTLYLCLEDSTLRIQNRLFEITEDAPDTVHFCTQAMTVTSGLTEQIESFLAQHPDTSLIIIDTLQMIRSSNYDNTYANDYRDLSVLKKLADHHSIAILLIHHLRKEISDDVFNRISGTTGVQGAADTCFILSEENRGSTRAKLFCVGRDIEYREITLQKTDDNIWELVSDSLTHPELLGDQIIYLLSVFLAEQKEFTGTPTELCNALQAFSTDPISPKKISCRILQNQEALQKLNIRSIIRRSNGKRLIELHRDSVDSDDSGGLPQTDPFGTANQTIGSTI